MRTDLARSALFAQFLRAGTKVLRNQQVTAGYEEWLNAVESIEQVASELEQIATEPSAEPDDAQMLDWVMENTDAGYRNGTNHGVHWVDGRAWHWTEGVDYEDAIRAAMQESAAIEAAASA